MDHLYPEGTFTFINLGHFEDPSEVYIVPYWIADQDLHDFRGMQDDLQEALSSCKKSDNVAVPEVGRLYAYRNPITNLFERAKVLMNPCGQMVELFLFDSGKYRFSRFVKTRVNSELLFHPKSWL